MELLKLAGKDEIWSEKSRISPVNAVKSEQSWVRGKGLDIQSAKFAGIGSPAADGSPKKES